MAEGRPESVIKTKKLALIIKILNVVLQKIIQIDKPAGYYKDREKTKTFIY